MSTTITTSYHMLDEKFQQKWYILTSANSLVFSCLLSSQSTVLTTIDLHVLNVVIHVSRINKKPFWSHTITTAYHILCSWKIPIEVIPPNVSDLAGLLLHVVLAIHIVVDHQLTCTSCCQTRCKKKKKMMTTETNTAYHILIGKKFKLKRYIPTATSLVFSS